MTPSHDTTADVPSLLEAMVGWLDPADDPAEPIAPRRWHAPTAVGDRPGPTAAARSRIWFRPTLRARIGSWPRLLVKDRRLQSSFSWSMRPSASASATGLAAHGVPGSHGPSDSASMDVDG